MIGSHGYKAFFLKRYN